MSQSQSSAEVAALGELGIKPTGVQVFEVTAKPPAFGKLKPADQIVSIDGTAGDRRGHHPSLLRSTRSATR